ncbi:hypothetical protein MMC18_007548 [Xylographa bjoerkii]|nr:hypothetical protein [Xylographa bjoerkii]
MAAPFSIVAVCETGANVAQKLIQLVKDLVSAPDELLALSNELWNLQLVLDDALQSDRDNRALPMQNTDKSSVLSALIYQARIKLDELHNMIRRWGKLSQWGDSWNMGRRDRFLWLKDKNRVVKLQAELRGPLYDFGDQSMVSGTAFLYRFMTIFSRLLDSYVNTVAFCSSAVSRIEVDIQNLQAECVRMFNANAKQSGQDPIPPDSSTYSASAISEIQEGQREARDILQNMLVSMTKLNLCADVDRRFDKYLQPPTSATERPLAYSDLPATNLPNTPMSINKPVLGASLLSVAVAKQGKSLRICPDECPCVCHSRTTFRTPEILQQITGRLFLGYSGRHVLQQECIESCLQRDAKSVHMTYFFPKWFFQRAISISMVNSLLGTPTLNIKVRRVVPEMSQLFSLSRYGDVEGLRDLFTKRLASSDDVHIRGGWTALHFAVDHGCVDICQLLLESGADPTWEDATGTTPIEIAWRNILHLRAPAQISETFSVLFPGTEYLQERNFTRLHRLVIDLEHGDMKEEVLRAPKSIHALDVDGWTPLHWAARRGNHSALILMLAHGADPHLPTQNESRNTLHLAAQGNSQACIKHLLSYRRGNKIMDINCKDGYGNTPLRISAGYNCAAATAELIEADADLNAGDRFDEPPLFSAVYENAHETITKMLRAGADYTICTHFGNTILHFAANESDAQTLSLLTWARMRGVSMEARNNDGLTAAQLAAARTNKPEQFMSLFERLVASIGDEEPDEVSCTSGGESWKSFEDAVWYEAEQAADEDVWNGEGGIKCQDPMREEEMARSGKEEHAAAVSWINEKATAEDMV